MPLRIAILDGQGPDQINGLMVTKKRTRRAFEESSEGEGEKVLGFLTFRGGVADALSALCFIKDSDDSVIVELENILEAVYFAARLKERPKKK